MLFTEPPSIPIPLSIFHSLPSISLVESGSSNLGLLSDLRSRSRELEEIFVNLTVV